MLTQKKANLKFDLGRIVATPGALEVLDRRYISRALARHQSGDWGECVPMDWSDNDAALHKDFRILSVYTSPGGVKFWIITEADRSATTVLLPSEY